ncbi:MAG: chloride channel protein [Acidimicrobiales bacterium]|nr:chloride channel protein [Acidimicrobiales bacterium]
MARRFTLHDAHRERLRALSRRSQQVLFFAAATGAVTGVAVAGFEWLTREVVYEALVHSPLWVRCVAPIFGLVGAALCIKLFQGDGTATADDYVADFHSRSNHPGLRQLPARVLASFFTLASGGALGYEGPAIYAGAKTGAALQHRLRRFFARDEAKVLLVAGAAAGVAAIFRAPATGVVFALEVPYRDDLARRQLIPAAIAAAAGYLTFVALLGTEPLLPVEGRPGFGFAELGGAVVLGLLSGGIARFFAGGVHWIKRVTQQLDPLLLATGAGVALAGLAYASELVYDEPLTLGAGYETVSWSLDPEHGVGLVLLLFAMRAAASGVTLGGRGVGGLFIPLVVQGALLGRIVGGMFGDTDSTLFPLIGIAAFLGAGYRVPLAAVMFVAETTGRAGFIVPGLIASVTAQLFMGRWSVSPAQVGSRLGHLERRFSMPIASALTTDVLSIPPEATAQEFFWNHVIGSRQQSVPVIDGANYCGLVRVDELRDVPREEWDDTAIGDIMRTDLPTGRPDWLLRQAVEAMDSSAVDLLPVTDDKGLFVGVVTMDEIVKLDDILDVTEDGS